MPDYIIVQNRGEAQVLEDDLFIHNLIPSHCHPPLGEHDSNLGSIKPIDFTLAIHKETNVMYLVVAIIGTDTRYFVEPDEEIKIGISELNEEVEPEEIDITALDEDNLRFELELKNIGFINCSLKREHVHKLFLKKG